MALTPVESALVDLIRAALNINQNADTLPDLTSQDWPSLVKAADRHGLAPLAYTALKKYYSLNIVPAGALEALRMSYLRASVANRTAFQELAYWIDRFECDNTHLIILKGGSLAVTLYDNIALRPMGDLDLLIRCESFGQVKDALIEQGYVASSEMAASFASRFSVEQSFLRMGKRPSQLDIHWHPFTSPYYFERIPVEWFWNRVEEIEVNSARALSLAPTAQLLYLSAHYMLHGYRRLIWSLDIALLIARRFDQIDWDEATRATEEFGLAQVLREALLEVNKQWGVSVPANILARLRAAHTPWKGRMMLAATSAVAGSGLELLAGIGLKGVRRKLIYWLRLTFPSASYMRERFQVRNNAMIPVCYLRRGGKGVYLTARAGLSIMRKAILSRL